MAFNLLKNVENCHVTVPSLLYYSHIPSIIISLFVSAYIFIKSKNLPSKILFLIAVSFSVWSISDIILWTTFDSRQVMLFWSFINFWEILVSLFSLYFIYVFLNNKDVSYKIKLIYGFLLMIFVLFTPTVINILGFDATNCEGIQGNLIYYYRFLEGLLSLNIIFYLIYKTFKTSKEHRSRIFYFAIGAVFFNVVISWINIYGTITEKWEITQYSFFSMPIFIAFLAYLIVKYKAFNIKLIGTQALVAALFILIGSQFFFIQNPTNIILNGITLALVLGFGYMLVKSVKLEVKRKEELQALSGQLSDANAKLRQLDKAKSEFISIASHQLRTPLTSIKGFGSLLLEGTYGVVPEAQRGALEKIYISNERLIQLVEDLLNISRIEAGRMEFDFQEAQIEDLVEEAVQTLELSAKAKNLYLHWEKPVVAMPKLKIDITKIKEVISNMVDNSIKYTQKGGITVKLETNTTWDTEHKDHKESVRVIVSDTGIGMDEEEIGMIFEKFQRGKQVSHYHTDGTGLGMYIGKKIVSEHKGRIWAESDGKGKGSRFILELPVD
jgi:signal transduction histidine kinase